MLCLLPEPSGQPHGTYPLEEGMSAEVGRDSSWIPFLVNVFKGPPWGTEETTEDQIQSPDTRDEDLPTCVNCRQV